MLTARYEGETSAGTLTARLDRLPASRTIWLLVLTLSLGGAFEYYDLFFTGYVVPGLVQEGLFSPEQLGPLAVLSGAGASGAGTFVFMTFAGLFVGALLFGSLADRFGRKAIFTWSLIWYSATTVVMALQHSGFWIDVWRLIAGIGLGVELVTIDTYLAELVPRAERGRAFAVNQVVSFLAVPLVALLAWLLVPVAPFGVSGWRWVVLVGSAGALGVWFIRRRVPESVRWLVKTGRFEEAEVIVAGLEAAVARDIGAALPPPVRVSSARSGPGRFAEIWQAPYGRRTALLTVFQVCQTIGFYGFAAWVPSLLIAKGIRVTSSLEYAFIIAISNPLGPLIGILVADRFERKWQIVVSAFGVAVIGLAFAQQAHPAILIGLGVLMTLAINWMSFTFHGYQAELFPTRIRARAVGFVYAWSRLSAAFAGLLIAFFLQHGGETAVFGFIASAMAIVMISIGVFGPNTRGLALEEVSPS